MTDKYPPATSCPIPISEYPTVQLAHGGGGKLMHNLIEKMFYPLFGNSILDQRHDGALLNLESKRVAFTTDSYVVTPLFFPGGDIGKLAVNGTVNDLAMCGAAPRYISLSFIIEEGFSMESLWKIVNSVKNELNSSGVQIVTGDTKVVDRGKADGIFINTTGIGIIEHGAKISPHELKTGDAVVVSGDIGRHGISIMASREGLEFETEIESDSTSLSQAVLDLISGGVRIRCLRDLTRGGLASALVEIATCSNKHIQIEEKDINVNEDVRGICEVLGLDPLYVANEGRFIAFIDPGDVTRALEILQKHKNAGEPSVIGTVNDSLPGKVTMKSIIGTNRIVDMISGEQLPRIC